MKLFNRPLWRNIATDNNPPVNTTAGESTSLLTQTAGALFGLMPALMSKAASAASPPHSPLDGDASAASGHAAPSVGGTGLAHAHGASVPPSATHDVPAAAVNHAPAQVAPHAQSDQSHAVDQVHSAHAARGSEAPQQLHLPDTSHDIPQAAQGPSATELTTASHETAALPQMAASQESTGSLAYADALVLHLQAADVGQDIRPASNAAPDVSGFIDHTLSDTASDAAALAGEVGASVGSLAHGTDALIKDVAQAPLDAAEHFATPTLAALDQPILHAGVSQAADNVDGAVQNVLSAAGHLSNVGLQGTSALDSGNDPVGSLSHDANTLLTSVTPADSGSHATSSILSESSNLGSLAHDAIAPLTSAGHAPTSGAGSEPTSLLGAGGTLGSSDHGASSDLTSATHSVGSTLGHIAGSGQSGADPASALHASAVPPQANASSSPAASLTHSVSDIGHAASQTSDGVPLHVPLIGQSFADQDVGHDAGFSLHVLHGI